MGNIIEWRGYDLEVLTTNQQTTGRHSVINIPVIDNVHFIGDNDIEHNITSLANYVVGNANTVTKEVTITDVNGFINLFRLFDCVIPRSITHAEGWSLHAGGLKLGTFTGSFTDFATRYQFTFPEYFKETNNYDGFIGPFSFKDRSGHIFDSGFFNISCDNNELSLDIPFIHNDTFYQLKYRILFYSGNPVQFTTYAMTDTRYTPIPSAYEITDANNPYSDGGSTQQGGGNGSFDTSSDPVSIPSLPSISAFSTGFITMWRPSISELTSLYNYMWSNAFDLDSFKKIFANPIDALLSFGIIPINPAVGAARNLKIGNIDTGLSFTPITAQYYTIDCGTLYLDNFFDTYLEFEPYSTLEIFLPFCGCMPLSSDDFYRRKEEYTNGGKINVTYNVDILSGACVAFLSCYDANGNTTMTYEFNGNMLTQIPLTGNDFTSFYNSILSIAGNVISGVAHAATGNAAGILGDVANAAHNVTSAKPTINRSGTIGGSYGLLANRKPFLIRNIPRQAVAGWQNLFQGFPSHITSAVKDLNGYTEFECIYIDNIPATDGELKELENLLKEGVVL